MSADRDARNLRVLAALIVGGLALAALGRALAS